MSGERARSAWSVASFRRGRDALFTAMLFGVMPALAQTVGGSGSDLLASKSPVGVSNDERVPDCNAGPMPVPLRLYEAAERALCAHPKAREAWASMQVQVDALGISRASYLPSVMATAQSATARDATSVGDHPDLSSTRERRSSSQALALDWVLFDFGRRDAAVRNSEQLLAAAQADHSVVLLDLFADVIKNYLGAQAAFAAVAATQEIQATAKTSLDAATGRSLRGVAPVSDVLQAQSALLEATMQHAKAQSDVQIALGALAISLGSDPQTPIDLPAIDEAGAETDWEHSSISELIEQAQRVHPRVLKARALLGAATAKLDAARSEHAPSVSLKGNVSHDNSPVTSGLGSPQFPARANNRSVAVVLSIPLFNGFSREHGVSQALHQVEVEEARLEQARREVAGELWTAFQSLQSAARAKLHSKELLDVAHESYEAASTRYHTGVGSVAELVSAQTALASARRRKLQAAVDWRVATNVLSSKVGRMPPRPGGSGAPATE